MNKKAYIISIVAVLAFLLYGIPASAVHKGAGDLTCGNCHTMHNSQGGSSFVNQGGTSMILIRADVSGRQEIHKLCLQCHSSGGVNAGVAYAPHGQAAPKVLVDASTWTQNNHLTGIGAGGSFNTEVGAVTPFDLTASGLTTALGKGHSIGLTNITPPGGDAAITAFSCTNCHDPHGTANAADTLINRFRNLRISAVEAANNAGVTLTAANFTSWVGGVTGTFATTGNYIGITADGSNVWPVINATPTGVEATDSSKSNSYGGGSTGGISRWCAQCHDNWHEDIVTDNETGATPDWKRHPVDNVLTGDGSANSSAGVDIIRLDNYDATLPGQYLPVASGTGSNRVFYKTDSSTDKVMCLSCHFAHGSPYNDILRWDYTSTVSLGNQTGNGIPSDRGCQLCHNR